MTYPKFDFSDAKFSDEVMTMEEVLKNEPSFDIPEEVIQGKKKLELSGFTLDKREKKIGVKVNCV